VGRLSLQEINNKINCYEVKEMEMLGGLLMGAFLGMFTGLGLCICIYKDRAGSLGGAFVLLLICTGIGGFIGAARGQASDEEYEQHEREREQRKREAADEEAKRERKAAAAQAKREREARIAEARSHVKNSKTHAVLSNSYKLSFDSESLDWDDSKIAGFFDNVAIGEVTLPYSLAIRKWEPDSSTDLTLPKGVGWKNDAAFAEIETAIKDEFGNDVMFRVKKAVLLLQNGHEDLEEGALVVNHGFEHVSLFVNMFQMGRRLNISIYTLFSPVPNLDAATMKPLAISLKKNQQPKIAAFENTVRAVALKAIAAAKDKLPYDDGVEY
jgi:hypothetical protein